MTSFRIDLYSEPHKALRKEMFELSTFAADCNFGDDNAVATLKSKAAALFSKLTKHAYSEDTYAHPIIGPHLLMSRTELEQDHKTQHEELDNLSAMLDLLVRSENALERPRIGAEWYRALNRFIAENLQHLDEEEAGMPHIWQACEQAELFAIMVAFSAHEEPALFPMIIERTNTDLNEAQRRQLWRCIHDQLGASIYEFAFARAQELLSPAEIDAIRL